MNTEEINKITNEALKIMNACTASLERLTNFITVLKRLYDECYAAAELARGMEDEKTLEISCQELIVLHNLILRKIAQVEKEIEFGNYCQETILDPAIVKIKALINDS